MVRAEPATPGRSGAGEPARAADGPGHAAARRTNRPPHSPGRREHPAAGSTRAAAARAGRTPAAANPARRGTETAGAPAAATAARQQLPAQPPEAADANHPPRPGSPAALPVAAATVSAGTGRVPVPAIAARNGPAAGASTSAGVPAQSHPSVISSGIDTTLRRGRRHRANDLLSPDNTTARCCGRSGTGGRRPRRSLRAARLARAGPGPDRVSCLQGPPRSPGSGQPAGLSRVAAVAG